MTLAQNETIIRSQDYFTTMTYLSNNDVALPLVWNYTRQEWPNLVERFSLNNRELGRVPKSISTTFSSQHRLDEMRAFFEKYPEAGAGARARKQALENVGNNIDWLERNEEPISNRLLANEKPRL